MKWRFILIGLSAVAGAAHAASSIDAKFDGVYATSAEMVPWMSASPACLSLTPGNVQIKGGIVTSATRDEPGAMRGFITAEGYLEASIVVTPPQTVRLNGRLAEGVLTAGAIDDKSGCAWIVKLTPHVAQDTAQNPAPAASP